MIFKYEEFSNFLAGIKKLGKFSLFKDWQGEPVFLLRHDVDFDLHLAHRLATIEHEMGAVATYFILTSCESYNILSSKSRKLLKEIIGMGHEIGLHFDASMYLDEEQDLAVAKEAEILSFAIGQKVRSISLHNPSVTGKYPLFENYVNAYDPKLFSDENYISDSCFSFRGKDPFAFMKNIDKGMVQILLHPMHYSESGGGYDEILFNTFVRYMNDIHTAFKTNSTYMEHVGEDFMAVFKKKAK
jgi:hypothetical protein